jgi:hypothetical protein
MVSLVIVQVTTKGGQKAGRTADRGNATSEHEEMERLTDLIQLWLSLRCYRSSEDRICCIYNIHQCSVNGLTRSPYRSNRTHVYTSCSSCDCILDSFRFWCGIWDISWCLLKSNWQSQIHCYTSLARERGAHKLQDRVLLVHNENKMGNCIDTRQWSHLSRWQLVHSQERDTISSTRKFQ